MNYTSEGEEIVDSKPETVNQDWQEVAKGMSFRFKFNDFLSIDRRHWDGNGVEIRAVAETANRLLDEHVASLVTVYAKQPDYPVIWTDVRGHNRLDTHRARLWDLQEIAPKKCTHLKRSMLGSVDMGHISGKCLDCGKRLVAKWEEA